LPQRGTFPAPPGHRERSPAPGSHRTWRAVFASLHLRCPAPRSSTGGSQHFAAIRPRFVSTVSFILSLHRGLSLPLHGARVAPERVICRQPLPPVNGSPVLRVLSTGLTSARPSDRPCIGGLSGLTPEPDGSPLFTSSPSVTCQRYEPRKRPDPLAVSRYRDAAFPVEGSGRPLRSRSILLRCPAGRGYLSVHLRSGLQPFCLRFAMAVTRHHARLDTQLPGSGFAAVAIPGD